MPLHHVHVHPPTEQPAAQPQPQPEPSHRSIFDPPLPSGGSPSGESPSGEQDAILHRLQAAPPVPPALPASPAQLTQAPPVIVIRIETPDPLRPGPSQNPYFPGSQWFADVLRILRDMHHTQEKMMSQITDYVDRVNAKLDAVGTGLDGITADVTFLKNTITKIQNSPGPISADDQNSLNSLEARVDSLAGRVATLDAQTDEPLPEPPVDTGGTAGAGGTPTDNTGGVGGTGGTTGTPTGGA